MSDIVLGELGHIFHDGAFEDELGFFLEFVDISDLGEEDHVLAEEVLVGEEGGDGDYLAEEVDTTLLASKIIVGNLTQLKRSILLEVLQNMRLNQVHQLIGFSDFFLIVSIHPEACADNIEKLIGRE